MAESACNSPARSIGDPNSLTDSELTDLESDSQLEIVTEVPGAPDQTIVDGWFKFRDNKRVRVFFLTRDLFEIFEMACPVCSDQSGTLNMDNALTLRVFLGRFSFVL